MAAEDVQKTAVADQGPDSKLAPTVSSAESSSSSTYDGPRAKQTDCAFDATEDPRYYKPIPEYEGAHRWDPDFEWTEAEEKAVVRKVCVSSSDISCPSQALTSWNRSIGAYVHLPV
jgi:hypothetical protein